MARSGAPRAQCRRCVRVRRSEGATARAHGRRGGKACYVVAQAAASESGVFAPRALFYAGARARRASKVCAKKLQIPLLLGGGRQCSAVRQVKVKTACIATMLDVLPQPGMGGSFFFFFFCG